MAIDFQSEEDYGQQLEAQPIDEADLAIILALHQRRLGWSYLLESIIGDGTVGFPCEKEEFVIRRELKKAFQKVSEWFRNTGQKCNWPSVKGWMWEIDFESSRAVPKKQSLPSNNEESRQFDSQSSSLVEGPVMNLSNIDLDIIKRLIEKREALSDSVRSQLRLFIDGEFTFDKLCKSVQELGAADKNVKDWYSEMAAMYKWPEMGNNNWTYRVDIEEKQVYLTYIGRSPF